MATSNMPDDFQSYDYYREQYLAMLRQQGQSPSQQENVRPGGTSTAPERPALQKSATSPSKNRQARKLPVPMARAATTIEVPMKQQQYHAEASRAPLQPQLNWDTSQPKPSLLRRLTPRDKRSESDSAYQRHSSYGELGPEVVDAVAQGRASTVRAPRRSNLAIGPQATSIAPPARYLAYEEPPSDLRLLHPLTPQQDPLYSIGLSAAGPSSPSSSAASSPQLADYRAPLVYSKPTRIQDTTTLCNPAAPRLAAPIPKRGTTMKILQGMTGRAMSRAATSIQEKGNGGGQTRAEPPAVIRIRSPRLSGGSSPSDPVQLHVGETSVSLPVVALGAVGFIVGGFILKAVLAFSQSILRFVVFCVFVAAIFAVTQYSNQAQLQQQVQSPRLVRRRVS